MIIRRGFEKYNRSNKSAKDKAALARSISYVTIFAPLMLIGVDETRDILYRKDQKKSFFDRTMDFLNINFGSIYFIGNLFSSLKSKISRGTWAGYDIDDPLTQTLDQIVDTTALAVKSIEQAITGERFKSGKRRGDEKWKASLNRLLVNSLDIAGKVKGVPVTTIRKFLQAPFKEPKKKSRKRLQRL